MTQGAETPVPPVVSSKSGRSYRSNPSIYYYGPAHPCHESMFLEPPEGFRFSANRDPSYFDDYTTAPTYRPMRRASVDLAGRLFGLVGSPRRVPIAKKRDLIHVDGAVLPITHGPWIVGGVEYASTFFSFNDTWYTRRTMRRSLIRLLSDRKCRKILTYSEASLNSLRLGLGEEFKSIEAKSGILPPAVPSKYLLRNPPKRDDGGMLRILLVGGHFFDKGGRELFYAFRRLRQKFDVELTLVTGAPAHHAEAFDFFADVIKKEPGVRLYSRLPKAILWGECYAKSDIFCLPSYMDTFGYVNLEAMANRLPIVSSDMFAIPEVVREGETGFLVHAPMSSFERDRLRTPESLQQYRGAILNEKLFESVVDSLEETLTTLLEDGAMRRRMGETAFKEVEHGRFSVPYRNRFLREVYLESLE